MAACVCMRLRASVCVRRAGGVCQKDEAMFSKHGFFFFILSITRVRFLLIFAAAVVIGFICLDFVRRLGFRFVLFASSLS